MFFWYNLKYGFELTEDVSIREMNEKGKLITILAEKGCNSMPDIVKDKVCITLSFKTANPENKIRICLKGNKEYKDTFVVDNLLVRRKDVDAYRMIFFPAHKDSVLTVNNYELR